MIGIYYPGTSWLHRAPPGLKLVMLLLFTTTIVIFRSLPVLAGAALLIFIAYTLARIPMGLALTQLRPLRWIVLLLMAFQWWLLGWERAIEIVGTLVLAVAAAALITLTTTTTAMLATLERMLTPARFIGVDIEKVALVLTLTIRVVPVIADIVGSVRDARRARGLERNARAFVTPVVIRTVGYSHDLGDALIARGVGD
ncbi:MAG: energy-coupling factor transporter transmembrane protein EcfT [Candidatus Nanopelagicales bacterium]|jgi:biotin transport system permease protein|nr:energy-coupling factor transporter transmembrane protein EcfT [Candidatus Nanopelagicales bacterium]MDP4824260.1 energy-coupling factor transporter transmembrane protein EcfT [Candidatus Nanopelagicales bacterium]MDP4887434.1 energy-coupling factor transporter transmembrane protein EcfT [Candidatus Nanopelagicales bacterium]